MCIEADKLHAPLNMMYEWVEPKHLAEALKHLQSKTWRAVNSIKSKNVKGL